jgi:hypothetical protein
VHRPGRLLLLAALVAGCVTAAAPPPRPAPPPVEEPAVPGERILLQGEPAAFVPTGVEDRSTTMARIVGVDIRGRITVESERGPVEVWVSDAMRYHFGEGVEITMWVRTGKLEMPPGGPATSPSLPLREAGDHSVVIGRVLSVSPRGTITVESVRGPVRVWVTPESGRYRAGDYVEVRTRVRVS